MSKPNPKKYSSLENALRLLDLFSVEKSEWKVKEIAAHLQIADSTAHRLLTTLEDEGFIVKDFISNSYRLGVSILSLGTFITSKMKIVKQSKPLLKELSIRFQETAQIGLLQGKHIYYANRIDYEHPVFGVQMYIAERKAPFHCTSAGKVLTSQFSDRKIIEFANDGLQIFTDNTISNIEHLDKEVKEVRRKGYAESYDEHYEDVSSVAVPIFNKENHTIAALELIGPSENLSKIRIKEIVESLKKASITLSNKI